MFNKLGWQVATEAKKNIDFSEVFDVLGLGVRVDLAKQHLVQVSVQKKPTRVVELGPHEVITRGTMSLHEAQSLRRLFAEQHA